MRKTICSKCGKIKSDTQKCACDKIKTINVKPIKSEEKKDYKNGIHSARWRKKRLFILKRDKGLCQRCLHKFNIFNGEQLTVHHIKSRKEYPELMFEDNNLITLCLTCNLQMEAKDLNHQLDFDITIEDNDFNL